MANIGYARVSSIGQSLEVQVAKLQDCDKIFLEKISSSSRQHQLEVCLGYIREGDTLVVSRLDRLARSTLHLCEIAKLLEEKQVDLMVLDQEINTSTPTGRLLFHVLSAISEFETELRAERQRDGIQKAKQKGVQFGRKQKLDDIEISSLKRYREKGHTIGMLMQAYNLSKSSVYRYLKDGDPE